MTTYRDDDKQEIAEVRRRLAPLADAEAAVPSADEVYWRARVRIALDQEDAEREQASLPIRVFHLCMAAGAFVLAAVISIWPLFIRASLGPAGALTVAAPIALLGVGVYLLTEVAPPRRSSVGEAALPGGVGNPS